MFGCHTPHVGRRAEIVSLRILVLTHYFPPELGAPQTRLRETAVGLVGLGHQVRVLTGPPHYPDGRVRPGYATFRVRHETIDEIGVTRLPMLPRPNGGFVDRMLDQGSFALSAGAAISAVRWADILLVESPPLFLGVTAAFHDVVTRRPYLFHVADPWPDFPIAMGALQNPVARRAAYGIERLAYRRARLITTVTSGLVEFLDRKPTARGRVRLLPNGVDVSRFAPSEEPAAVRQRLGWPEARLTLVYVGSVGLAQGLTTLLDAVEPLGAEGIAVRVIGEGYERERLVGDARARRMDHVTFDSPVAASQVPDVLAAADAALIMLRRGPFYDHSLPTKLVEALAAGRPLIVSAGGEAARLVEESGSGYTARPEDAASLRSAILVCLADHTRASRGIAARRLAETAFDRPAIVARLSGYLEEAMDR
jgi:colanic acid biosynthesis glycosyl transferase WcaI